MRKKATRKPRNPRPPREESETQMAGILDEFEDDPEPDTRYGGW